MKPLARIGHPRQHKIENDYVVFAAGCIPKAFFPVTRAVNSKARFAQTLCKRLLQREIIFYDQQTHMNAQYRKMHR